MEHRCDAPFIGIALMQKINLVIRCERVYICVMEARQSKKEDDILLDIRIKKTGADAMLMRRYIEWKMKSERRPSMINTLECIILEARVNDRKYKSERQRESMQNMRELMSKK